LGHKENNLSRLSELVAYYKENGRIPNIKDKDKNARTIASWLNNMRQKIRLKGEDKYSYLISAAKELGIPDIFKRNLFKDRYKARCQELIDFYIKNGRGPRESVPEELALIGWQRAYKHNNPGKFREGVVEELREMVAEAGLPGILSPRAPGLEILENKLVKAVELIHKYGGALPLKSDTDESDLSLRDWIVDLRSRVHREKMDKSKADLIAKIFREAGFTHVLEKVNDRSSDKEKLLRFLDILDIQGEIKYVQYYSKEGSRLNSWYYYNLRLARNKDSNFDTDLIGIAAERGYPNLFS
jgi:hypothetical protein